MPLHLAASHTATKDISLACQIFHWHVKPSGVYMARVCRPFNMLIAYPGRFKQHQSSGAHPKIFVQPRPSQTSNRHRTAANCRKPTKLFINASPHIITSHSMWAAAVIGRINALSKTILHVLCPKLLFASQETQYDVLHLICRTKCRWNVLNRNNECILIVWNTRYHLFGVD